MTFANFGKIKSIASRMKIRSALSVTYAVRSFKSDTRCEGPTKQDVAPRWMIPSAAGATFPNP